MSRIYMGHKWPDKCINSEGTMTSLKDFFHVADSWWEGKTPRQGSVNSLYWSASAAYFYARKGLKADIPILNRIQDGMNIHEAYDEAQLEFVKFFLSHFKEIPKIDEKELEDVFI